VTSGLGHEQPRHFGAGKEGAPQKPDSSTGQGGGGDVTIWLSVALLMCNMVLM
jgi:hypothetical protein